MYFYGLFHHAAFSLGNVATSKLEWYWRQTLWSSMEFYHRICLQVLRKCSIAIDSLVCVLCTNRY